MKSNLSFVLRGFGNDETTDTAVTAAKYQTKRE